MEVRGIEFPAPAKRLSLNDRLHWRKRHELEQVWQMAAFVAARNAKLKGLGPSVVNITYVVQHHRRRDPHNFAATSKPILDGMVQAGVWPDDNSDWVTVNDPVFWVNAASVKRTGEWVRVEIEEIT